MSTHEIETKSQAMVDEVQKVIVGKREAVSGAVLCLLCNGHLLLEDIPGVGKPLWQKPWQR